MKPDYVATVHGTTVIVHVDSESTESQLARAIVSTLLSDTETLIIEFSALKQNNPLFWGNLYRQLGEKSLRLIFCGSRIALEAMGTYHFDAVYYEDINAAKKRMGI